jgi:DNA repair photolyase
MYIKKGRFLIGGMNLIPLPIHGRGSSDNPANRFDPITIERDPEFFDPEDPLPQTQFYRDDTKKILTTNNSPDIPYSFSVNPYRGCEHGCIYCYARPTHEYIGLSAGLDFETKIFVKEDAPELLRKELSSPKWVPQHVSISGVTDPYQPVERKLKLTRRILEVFLDFRNPVGMVTKNALIERDIDILKELASFQCVGAFFSITTLDNELAHAMEPRASIPSARLRALETLANAGVPVGILMGPVIPGLNDHEVGSILQSAANAGARMAGYIMVKLPYAVKELFEKWLEQHYPGRKDKVLNRIREVRNGKLNDPRFGTRMKGEGPWAELFKQIFKTAKKKAGINDAFPEMSTKYFRNPRERGLFDDIE